MIIIDWLWQGLVVAVVATLAMRLIPASAAATRHAMWWLALAVVGALPWVATGPPDTGTAVALPAVGVAAAPALLTVPALPAWCLGVAVALWVASVIAGFARVAWSLRALHTLKRDAGPLGGPRESRLVRWTAVRAASRPADLRVADAIRGACAIGFWRPTILVSSAMVATLDDDALDAIVLHEHAHLERYDDWTRLLQQLVLAVVGLHPAVRWISRHIDLEREVACDQRVIARTGTPIVYARSLADAAAVVCDPRAVVPLVAPGSSITASMLHTRVKRLLNMRTASRQLVLAGLVATVAGVVAAVAAVSQVPPIVAVERLVSSLPDVAMLSADGLAPLALDVAVRHVPIDSPSVAVPAAQSIPRQETPSSAPFIALAQGPATTADGVSGAVDVDASSVVATSTPPVSESALLSARSMSAVASAPANVAMPAPAVVDGAGNAFVQPFVNMGTAAANAGTMTGQGAAYLGTSVGRFFKNGGLAIARSF